MIVEYHSPTLILVLLLHFHSPYTNISLAPTLSEPLANLPFFLNEPVKNTIIMQLL